MRKNVGLEGGKRREGTNLFKLFLFVAFFNRTEHPFCHGLVADTEFDGSIQDGSSENGVGVPSPGPGTGRMSVHGEDYTSGVENADGGGKKRVTASVG